METHFDITYRHIPSEIVEDFKNLEKSSLTVKFKNDRKEYFNFTGGPSDIEIFINSHITELIVTGLILPATYDAIKHAIKSSWKKLTQHYKQRNFSTSENSKIELGFRMEKGEKIDFSLVADADEKIINSAVDQMFKYLNNKLELEQNLKNKDFQDPNSIDPQIRLFLNKKTGNFEPINFTKLKTDWDKIMKDVEKLDS